MKGGETLALGARTAHRSCGAPGHTPDSLAILADGHLFTRRCLLLVGGADEPDFMGGSASALFDTFLDLRAPARRHDRASRARLCRSGGTTTIGAGDGAQLPLPRARPCGPVARLSGSAPPPANMEAILRQQPRRGHDTSRSRGPGPHQRFARRGPRCSSSTRGARSSSGGRATLEGALNVPLDALDARLEEIPEAIGSRRVPHRGARHDRRRGGPGPGAGRRARCRRRGNERLAPGPDCRCARGVSVLPSTARCS